MGDDASVEMKIFALQLTIVKSIASPVHKSGAKARRLPKSRGDPIPSRASGRDPHRQFADPLDEGREHTLRLTDNLDSWQAIEDFLPQDLQLHFGQALADAAVNAEAERQMLARSRTIDDEPVGLFDRLLVAVARDVP